MLSSVLSSKRAIHVNIQIVRTFTKIRKMILTQDKLAKKIEELERKYDKQFKIVFDVFCQLLIEEENPSGRLGLCINNF